MDVSVVICAYTLDRWPALMDAVRSVQGQTMAPREVIVVVDGNEQLLARARAELVGATVVLNDGVPGLSGGRMTGARVARGAVLAFLDDDAAADPDWLEKLLGAYEDDRVLGAGGSVVPRWQISRPRWLPPEFDWIVGCSYSGMPETAGPIRNPIGANMSMRASVLAAAGGFAGEFGRLERHGRKASGTADETELSIRAARLHPGGYWLYCPAARVHHIVTPERATWAYFLRRCQLEGTAKALLTRLAGEEAGLRSERRYVRSVLPRAVVRELKVAARGHPWALIRAAVIVVGLAVTALFYLRGLLGSAEPSPASSGTGVEP